MEVARRAILVNAYALTTGFGIPGALINAYGRGVAVPDMVESGCGAVTLGRTYLFPPLSSGGALLARP